MRLSRKLLALLACLTLALTLGTPASQADPADPADPAGANGKADPRADQALVALATVQDLLAGLLHPRGGSVAPEDPRSLTIALRDLTMLKDALPAAERAQADRILMRPGEGDDPYISAPLPDVSCGEVICVHYTTAGRHASAPAYVAKVLATMERVNDTYVDAGYRRPKPDGSVGGGTDMVDVYLGDIGSRGLYGYCTTDDPNRPDQSDDYSFWAYCTLDNDYGRDEFPAHTPLQNMRVTAAHEYFHAVQYAYDAWEDGWIIESTATWAEDELFDQVDDNRQYLRSSPLSSPRTPVDRFGGTFHYGTWILWRFLTEKYDVRHGALPNLVLQVWRQLDGTPGGPDLYSSQGLARVLGRRDTSLRKELALFAAANRHPGTAYSEGDAPAYRPAAPAAWIRVGAGSADPAAIAIRRNHLSSATARFAPRDLDQRDWRLRLALDLPARRRGAEAVVLVFKKGGGVTTTRVRLRPDGDRRVTVPFSTGAVRRVEVVLVNASSRFTCWQNTAFSCQGVARHDDARLVVDAKAFRA